MVDTKGLKHWLEKDGCFLYKKATKLSQEESKDDPETNPYKSKYTAREILLQLKNELESISSDADVGSRLRPLKSVVQYDLALNYIDTDEKSTGEHYLNELTDKVEDYKLEPEFCSVVMKCYQQLGILWNGRREYEKSLIYLSNAEKLYNEFKKSTGASPYDTEELFLANTEDENNLKKRDSRFENLHTHTLYYITQVYKNLGENRKSATYCHNTLCRQLITKMYDPADWAVNCATLSQYHLTQENYKSARHCLACASLVIAECPTPELKETVEPEMEGEDETKSRDCVPQAKANVALCWSKYCLNLLGTSSQRAIEGGTETGDSPSPTNDEEMQRFEILDVAQLESEVPCKIAKDYEEARVLFLIGQKHLNDAKEFYRLDDYVTNHVEIIQDHSQLFKHLAVFDSDLERQCKMCKRRVDMLSQVLVELNPQHYLLICRQLIFEIASIYGDMADLKTAIIKANEPQKPSAHQIKKINSLLANSGKFYTSFIDSLKQDEKLPEKYEESVLRVALLAHLCLARSYSKRICAEKEEKMENVKKALELFKYVMQYCDNDEEGAKNFEDELQACREMVDLLPLKLSKIAQGKE